MANPRVATITLQHPASVINSLPAGWVLDELWRVVYREGPEPRVPWIIYRWLRISVCETQQRVRRGGRNGRCVWRVVWQHTAAWHLGTDEDWSDLYGSGEGDGADDDDDDDDDADDDEGAAATADDNDNNDSVG